jgi:hypothetical protein
MMLGQLKLPRDPSLLSILATEMGVYCSLDIPDMPLESAYLLSSLGADLSFENSLQKINSPEVTEMLMNFLLQNSHTFSPTKKNKEKKKQPIRRTGGKISLGDKQLMVVKNKKLPFHSNRFNTDVTDQIINVLQEKATVCAKEEYTYFGLGGVGFQCGVCVNSLPKLDFTFASRFMTMEPPEGKKPKQENQ